VSILEIDVDDDDDDDECASLKNVLITASVTFWLPSTDEWSR